MAQDFGDDAGELLVRSIGDAVRRQLDRFVGGKAAEWFAALGKSQEEAAAIASREQVCIRFGDKAEAVAFAKVLEQNRLHCTALTDKEGNGFVQFFVDDLDKIKRCVPEFADVLLRQQEWRLAQALAADPIDREAREGLTEAYAPSPEAARRAAQRATERAQERTAREHVVDDRANDPYVHTKALRDKAEAAREQCRDFEDFKAILAREGVGVGTSAKGEVLIYEARLDEAGNVLPRGKDPETGLVDWAVSASTLKGRWGLDVTHDWFEANTPKDPAEHTHERTRERNQDEPTATMGENDVDGATPAHDQGVKSHDGMDTDATTQRIEREQSATDVAPSDVRRQEEQAQGDGSHDDGRGYDLDSECRDMTRASEQLEREGAGIDIPERFEPSR